MRLIFILILAAITCHSQPITPTVTVINEGGKLCGYNNINLKFKVKYTGTPDSSKILSFQIKAATGFQYFGIFTVRYVDLPTLTQVIDTNGETIYSLPIALPNLNPGQYFVCNGYDPGFGRLLYIYNCVGIEELYLSKPVENPIYYDLTGNRIEKVDNTLIIEQVGTKRRKILIQQ